MRKKRRFLEFFILAAGLMVFLYPFVSNFVSEKQQENVIVGYESIVENSEKKRIQEEWKKAKDYNLYPQNYDDVLNIDGNGIMGFIEIPKIDVSVPIYHDTHEEILKKGIGHVKQTELPIGEKGNHPVLIGHRGLPGNELFTRLDELEEGDLFELHILDKVFLYKVSRISVVLPEEINHIPEEEGKDLVTLVTCTPYGVNTHRLLVKGERTFQNVSIENEVEDIKRNKIIIYLIILLTGVVVLMYPIFQQKMFSHNIKRQKTVFLKECSVSKIKMEGLYRDLMKENEKLFANQQEMLINEESYQKPRMNLSVYGIQNNTIGFLYIPKMKITLPILLGANEENMKKGAVHLTETSYPVGGNNSNCVIAAHRGYSKAAMFRNIDKLEKGDKVYIRNFRNRLVYKVTDYKIVEPSDIESIMIQKGKDMVTLVACHPYGKNVQRYLVFCERM